MAAYKLDYGSALYWPAFMSQACTIFSCMKITYTASDKKLGDGPFIPVFTLPSLNIKESDIVAGIQL